MKFLFILLLALNLHGQTNPDSILHIKLMVVIEGGLNYLQKTQRQTSNSNLTFRGEWPTYMGLQNPFVLLGNRNSYDDSNCFSIASIHNSLARIYLLYPEYKSILPMLDLAFDRVMGYKNEDKFNFWNSLPPNRDLKKGENLTNQPLVRRPTTYKLKSRYINNAANIVDDADDTSLGYAAIALRNKILEMENHRDSISKSKKSVSSVFDQHRDLDRNNLHWYNYINGNDRQTGAYLTWLGKEFQFDKWYLYKVLGHNTIFFLPSSQCFPHPYVPYVPYGTNDLDGVVNANVLTCLSLYGELQYAKGTQSAIGYIEKKSKLKKYDRVGVYYPNRYQFPYAVSLAYKTGVPDLEMSMKNIFKTILDNQNEDGSWCSKKRLNHGDYLQSTAYAVNTLINLGQIERFNTKIPIEKAIRYLLNHKIEDLNGIHWKGGVFFSGGTVVRNVLLWKSDAYTTAIILQAFVNYRKIIEQNRQFAKP